MAITNHKQKNDPLEYYAIAIKETITYGHGSYGEETHVIQKNAYGGEFDFHPLFQSWDDAIKYIEGLRFKHGLFPVKLTVYRAS